MTEYLPEGSLINSQKNKAVFSKLENIIEAQKNGTVLEAKVILCNAKHDLVDHRSHLLQWLCLAPCRYRQCGRPILDEH